MILGSHSNNKILENTIIGLDMDYEIRVSRYVILVSDEFVDFDQKFCVIALTCYVIFDFDQEIFAVKLIFHVFALIRYVIFHLKIFENFALRYVILGKCVHVIARVIFFV